MCHCISRYIWIINVKGRSLFWILPCFLKQCLSLGPEARDKHFTYWIFTLLHPHHSSQFGLLTLLPSLNKLTLWSTSMKNISRHSGSSEQRYFQSSALGLALKRAVYQRSHFSGKHSFVVKNKVKLTTVSQAPWVFISQPEKYTNLIYLFIIYFVILFPLLTWRLNFTEQCHLKN